MAIYSYKAKAAPEVLKNGTIEAESEKAAIHKLLQLNYHPVQIRLISATSLKKYSFFKKINQKEIYVFLRQLSNLIQAGLPLVKALNNIGSQHTNIYLRTVVSDIKEKIQQGHTFSESLNVYPELFSSLEVNIIKSAETSGTLSQAMAKIADLKEKELSFSVKIKSALAYPVLLICVGIITLFVLTTFVLPKFITLFQDLGQQLPIITKLLISVSMFLKNSWFVIILAAIFMILSFIKYIKTEKGRLWFDTIKMRTPFLKPFIVKLNTGRFARTLANLLENGVPILNSLQIISDIIGNKLFAQEIKKIYADVAKGKHLSQAMKNCNLFENSALDLISAGEESGQLEEMLLRIAKLNEEEASQQIETFIFMLEPALILVLGFIIAIIVMAILLPIFQMNFLVQ